jgi:predicted nucleic acid-binding protein
MPRTVLADTGPLYAAVDPDDRHHARAHRELLELGRQKTTVALAYPTLLEAYTLILYRLGRPSASRWLHEIVAGTSLINPTSDDYRAAVAKVDVYVDQSITLFDATSAVMAVRLGIPVWTYDYHFDVMGIPVWR